VSAATRRALVSSIGWTLCGFAFTPVVLWVYDAHIASAYLSAFVLEKTLSLDNVAMFAAILGATTLPPRTASRVLTGGLLGALVLRVVFIAAGLAVVDAVHSVLLAFAVILVASGVQMMRGTDDDHESPPSPRRWMPAAVRRQPALAALAAITIVDVAFAADSILAAFAITTSAVAIIAANVFAVLGLRPLYVLLSGAMERFRYLKAGIGTLLIAIGLELAIEHWVDVAQWVSMVLVATCLLGSIGASLIHERRTPPP
jgi:tellurite resistance protein TerC